MMEEIAKRAVACRHWRWMPGMLSVHVDEDGEHYPYRCRRHWRGHVAIGQCTDGRPEDNAEFCLPDLTDPATVGCLLALVREAWGVGSLVYRPFNGAIRTWRVVTFAHDEEWMRIARVLGEGATEAEALVAALEAAP